MKRLLTFLSLSVFAGYIFCQSANWSYGLNVQAGYSGKTEMTNLYYANEQSGDYSFVSKSKIQPSAGVGIWLENQVAKRWGLYLGIDYLQLNTYTRSETTSYNLQQRAISYGRDESGVNQQQLQAPLKIRFYFGQSNYRWRLFISGGLQAQYLLRHTNFYNRYDGVIGFPDSEQNTIEAVDFNHPAFEYKRLQFGLSSGLGIHTYRFRFSVQRSWSVGNYRTEFSDLRCGNALGAFGCFGPAIVGKSEKLLQQTSLRVQYRLH